MVRDSTSDIKGSGGNLTPLLSYAQHFREVLPYYISIGMTPDEFWNGDPELAVWYRKAFEVQTKRRNQEMWLQGMYVYEAIMDVAPILRAFAKKGTKASPYPSEPYALNATEKVEAEERKSKAAANKGFAKMEAWMMQFNKKFEKKEVERNAN